MAFKHEFKETGWSQVCCDVGKVYSGQFWKNLKNKSMHFKKKTICVATTQNSANLFFSWLKKTKKKHDRTGSHDMLLKSRTTVWDNPDFLWLTLCLEFCLDRVQLLGVSFETSSVLHHVNSFAVKIICCCQQAQFAGTGVYRLHIYMYTHNSLHCTWATRLWLAFCTGSYWNTVYTVSVMSRCLLMKHYINQQPWSWLRLWALCTQTP